MANVNPPTPQQIGPSVVPLARVSAKQPIVLATCLTAVALTGPAVSFHSLSWWWSPAEFACLVLALLFLCLTTVMDPGTLEPSATRDPVIAALEQREAECADRIITLDGATYTHSRRGVWMRQMAGRPQHVDKYCATCNVWRPPRAHHCAVCGACVEHFDHHCAIMSTCIAKRNHRWFTLFLLSALAGATLLSTGAVLMLRRAHFPGVCVCAGILSWMPEGLERHQTPVGKSQSWQVWPTVCLTPVYFYAALVLLFGIAHLALMLTDYTSKELVVGVQICQDKPCCPGARSPPRLLGAWRDLWCGPCRLKRSAALTQDSLVVPIYAEHDGRTPL